MRDTPPGSSPARRHRSVASLGSIHGLDKAALDPSISAVQSPVPVAVALSVFIAAAAISGAACCVSAARFGSALHCTLLILARLAPIEIQQGHWAWRGCR